MAKYSLVSFTKAQEQAQAMGMISKTARERLAQMFIDLYMTPGSFADAPHRLGRAIALAEEETTVSASKFPPYATSSSDGLASVTHEDLPFRLGGFKATNDRINAIQSLLMMIYGEIRTKITEWDISVYIQEGLISEEYPLDLKELSLLYRIKEDNPRKYSDHRAYIYGIINTACSMDRWRRWDPRLDPELRYWASPTSSLELWAFPPKPRLKRVAYSYRKKTRWWGRRRTFTGYRYVWYVPRRPRLNGLQTREVHRALAAKWTNWFPPYWKLFFWSADINSLGTADEENMSSKHMQNKESMYSSSTSSMGGKFSLSRFKSAKKNRSKSTSSATLAAQKSASGKLGVLGKTVKETGINTRSPIWKGGPVGRYKDPRSLAGYLSNEPNSWNIPKIAPTRAISHPINRRTGAGINQMEGIYRLLYGWSTWFWARRERDVRIRVWVRTSSDNYYNNSHYHRYRYEYTRRRVTRRYAYRSGSRTSYRTYTTYEYGYYDWRTIRVPYWAQITRTGQFPDLTGTIRYEKPRYMKSTVSYFWFWSFSRRGGYLPGKYIIESGSVMSSSAFRSRFTEKDRVPVMFMSADQSMVATATIQDDIIFKPRRRYRRKRRWFRRRRYVGYWVEEPSRCYTVHAAATSQFMSGVGGQAYSMVPASLSGFLGGRSRLIRGFFFNLPARGLTGNDNIITDKWNNVGVNSRGPQIARALTTCGWRNRRGQSIARSLPWIMTDLHKRLYKTLVYLQRLETILKSVDSRVMRALVDELPDDTKKLRTMVLARRRFAPRNIYRIQQYISNLIASITPLIELTRDMRTESGLTYSRIQSFRQSYSRVSVLTSDRYLYNTIDSFLNILYEWRAIYLKQRMNKTDGTLLQLARIESIDIPTAEGEGVPPSMANTLIDEILQVVHKTTNIGLAQRSQALRNKTLLPTERIHYAYVPVQYTNEGEIVRHKAGDYDLLSLEYMQAEGNIPRVRFFITFEGVQAPPIVQNVITGVDPNELQKIMDNKELSILEKICAARDTQDWWKIKIPEPLRPLTKDFDTNIVLMLTPEDARIEGLMALLGDIELSPILEHEAMETADTMAAFDLNVKQANSTSLKANK